MRAILKLITIILMALLSFKAYGDVVRQAHHDNIIYELIIDFGNDFAFIHEVTKDKSHCEFRAKAIMIKDDVKAYCIRREF